MSAMREWTPTSDVRAAYISAMMLCEVAGVFAVDATSSLHEQRVRVVCELIGALSLKPTVDTRSTTTGTIFSAVQTALARQSWAYCFMDSAAAEHTTTLTLEEEGQSVTQFVGHQLQTRPTANQRVMTLLNPAMASRDACGCGKAADRCERLQHLLTGRRVKDDKPFLCCVCVRQSMRGVTKLVGVSRGKYRFRGSRRRRRFRHDNDAVDNQEENANFDDMCKDCGDRLVITAISRRTAPKDFIILRDPSLPNDRQQRMPEIAAFVQEFARAGNNEALYALRVGATHNTTLPTPFPRMMARHNDRPGVAAVINTTRRMIQRATSAADKPTTARNVNVLIMLEILEMMSMRHRATLLSMFQNNEIGALVESVTAMTEEQLLRAGSCTPSEVIIVGSKILFPLCQSAVVECGRFKASTTTTSVSASKTKQVAYARSHSVLFAGRVPRPLAGFPSEFVNLLFLNMDGSSQR
jgi:hypothetical protein